VRRLVLGTRGSELARAQASLVEAALCQAWPDLQIDVEIITTSGDKADRAFRETGNPEQGLKGLFTAEIERALVRQQIDIAVHSAKDLPGETTAGLEICAVLPRAPVEDVLVSKSAPSLMSLVNGAVVGTGSVRRQSQLRWRRPDLQPFNLRGNVPTRLRKLDENPWEAIVLARAGIERLGYTLWSRGIRFGSRTFHTEILDPEWFLPAGGQGIVAIQVRGDDERTVSTVARINDQKSLTCLAAEREFLRLLHGDCNTPVGVLATVASDVITLRAHIFEEGRVEPRRGSLDGSATSPLEVAKNLWVRLDGR